MHLAQIDIKNFKCFENGSFFLDRPLTLLVGQNSAGKSSMIKAILGLKQTFSSGNDYEVLAAQGDFVDLGTYADYVHNHDTRRCVTFRLVIEDQPKRDRSPSRLLTPFILRRQEIQANVIEMEFDLDAITEQARIKRLSLVPRSASGDIAEISVERMKTRPSYWVSIPNKDHQRQLAELVTATTRETDSEEEGNVLEATIKAFSKKYRMAHVDRFQFIPLDVQRRFRWRYEGVLFDFTMLAPKILQQLFDHAFYYLGPLRSSPSRSYTRTTHAISVGPRGEYTPSVFSNLERRAAKATAGRRSDLRDRLDMLADSVDFVFKGRTIRTETLGELVKLVVSDSSARRSKGGAEVIADVGFGFSQVLPILVQMAVMPVNSTLIIEQPELHLHPQAQARLAQVIAKSIGMGRRFLIETHSEHFIRGLQLAVSEHTVHPRRSGLSSEDVRILYFSGGKDTAIEINLDPWGEFTREWPSGFFDEAYQLSRKRLKNKLEHA